jgi:tetratricopeptide (TPR) repeat protein
MDIGDVQRQMGAHDAARASYERALLVEPGEVTVLERLIVLEAELGDFEAAERRADEALAASRLPETRAAVYYRLDEVYYLQGRYQRLIDNYRDRVAALAASGDPLPATSAADSRALRYAAEAGRETWALAQLDSLRALVPAPFSELFGAFFADLFIESGDLDRARAEAQRSREGAASFGAEVIAPYLSYSEGALAEAEGDCRSAVVAYREAVPGEQTTHEFPIALARCQRKLGELEDAETTLLGVLKVVPADAKARYQLALVYEAMGRTPDAVEQLVKAVDIWKNADADYVPAQEARAKLRELAP